MEEQNAPKISNKFFCILSSSEITLAAIISSYTYIIHEYTPLFEFPNVTTGKPLEAISFDEHYLSVTRAEEFKIKVHNAIKLLGGCDYLVLGGLSDDQKSYLDFLDNYNVIEVDNVEDVDFKLSALTDKGSYQKCTESDIYYGLIHAGISNSKLKIDPYAQISPNKKRKKNGIIVIEKNAALLSILAINYALSIGADIELIEPPDTDKKEIKYLLERWSIEKNDIFLNDLGALVYNRIENIDFENYEFGTFFTFGTPYSLVLKNVIPFTYVNNLLSPDFFVFNIISSHLRVPISSSIVFSPLEFIDEETNFIIGKLEDNNHYVKKLVGRDASVFNVDNHVREYPFEIIHFCSHGGEVDGFRLVEEFTDKEGASHTVEYDEIVSFAPDSSEELIQVTSKYIWRKFNGLIWKSEELKEANYPHYVFTDMLEEIKKIKGKSRKKKLNITGSCAIKCSDFNYQAVFNMISGSHTSPFVFNNTCWSWSCISESFLSTGSIGYIGTFWAVDNNLAKETAETFYTNIFEDTILNSLQKALIHTTGTSNENIYMYWGLHFSTLRPGNNLQESKKNVANKLLCSFYRWINYSTSEKDSETKEQIETLINWNYNQLFKYFFKELIELIKPRK